jgi:hypothetical protein
MHPTRIFKTPEALEKVWIDYKKDLSHQASKWEKVQYVGKDGERREDYPKLPLTLDGFEVYCYEHYGCVGQYFDNQKSNFNDFIAICSRIKKEIRADQITGGMLGFYNTSITQRLNNLKEQTDNINHNNINILNIDPLDDSNDNGTT